MHHNQLLLPTLRRSLPGALCALGLPLLSLAAPAQTVLLSEGFEGAFPGDWIVEDQNEAGGLCYWSDVPELFGGEGAHSGLWKGYCAGTGHGGTFENPTYCSFMESSMSVLLDLREFTEATLSFWYKLPSVEPTFDTAKVIIASIDPVTVWSSSTPQSEWTEVTIDLSPYVGTIPGLAFEFTTDESVTHEGWYLDDIEVIGYTPPFNDQCFGAVALATCVPAETDTTRATSGGDPIPACQANFGKGVWFSYVPPEDGPLLIHTCGSDFDTVLQVFEGECGSLVPVPEACNDDFGPACEGAQASLEFFGLAGVRYTILAGGFAATGGNLQIVVEPAAAPPLEVGRDGSEIVLAWPPQAGPWRLHTSPNLHPESWSPVANPGALLGGVNVVREPILDPQRFYQLRCANPVVPMEELLAVAEGHARTIWDEELLTPGEAIPIGDGEGAPFSYLVPYARGAATFPPIEAIFEVVHELKEAFGPLPAEGSENLPEEFYVALEDALGPMGFVQVSATRENYPVLLTQKILHPWFLFHESALNRARQFLGTDDVGIEGYVMRGPCDEYFVCNGGGQRAYIHARALFPLTPEEYGGLPTYRVPSELAADREQAWNEVLGNTPPPPANQLKWIANYDMIPIVNWTYWCVPTAYTMLVGFYDHYLPDGRKVRGYGRVIDYWSENGTGHNVPNFIDEMIDPTLNPPSWRAGVGFLGALNNAAWNDYNFTATDFEGDSDNDWAWSGLVAELDTDRPAIWSSAPLLPTPQNPDRIGHAMTAYGYRVVGAQKFVIVYNTWGTTRQQQQAEYAWNQWIKGGAPRSTGWAQVRPGGGTDPDDAALLSPRGGEVVFGASQIQFQVTGTLIKTVQIYDSTDAGANWSWVANVTSTGPGLYTQPWTPPSASNRGRVRIVCLDGSGNIIAGDGSVKNVFFQALPDLHIEQTQPGYCDVRGGKLVVTVANQGPSAAGTSTTEVVFQTGSGPQSVQLATPAVPAHSSVEVLFDFPPGCGTDCLFQIRADATNAVGEANEGNNMVSGGCLG